jgi:hypothetical protein
MIPQMSRFFDARRGIKFGLRKTDFSLRIEEEKPAFSKPAIHNLQSAIGTSAFRNRHAFTEIFKTSILLDKLYAAALTLIAALLGLFQGIARIVIVEREMPVR